MKFVTTLFELFRFLVMPFGLCNVLVSFQSYMDQALQSLERELIAYLDDILIYSSTLDKLQICTRYYPQCLRDNRLFAKLKKYKFEVNQTRILGFEVNEKGIFIEPECVLTILNVVRTLSRKRFPQHSNIQPKNLQAHKSRKAW